MHFGRVTDPGKIDFTLPDDHPQNLKILPGKPAKNPKVYAGCPVWSDKGYVGRLYPKGTKSDQFVNEYAKQFQAIELNALGYGLPPMSTIHKWVEAATPGFKFCPKFPQNITHRRDFMDKRRETDAFLNVIVEMGDHAGMCLFQLPEHFKPARLEELVGYMASLPEDLDVAVEVRNEAWFTDWQALDDLCAGLTEAGKSLVITDTPGRRDALHMRLTIPKVFIRLNGTNRPNIDLERTNDWIATSARWLKEGLREMYFFAHQPDKYKAAYLAAHYIQGINSGTSLNLPTPKFYNETPGLF